MADAGSKINIFFEASGGTAPTGWTETFWSDRTDLKALLLAVRQQYIPKRRDLLGVGARLQAIRVSNIPPNRVSYVYFTQAKEGNGTLFDNAGPDDYDPTQVDLLWRLQTVGGKRRQFYMSGLPDSVTDQIQDQGVTGAFVNSAAVKQWQTAVQAIPMGIRFKTADGPPPVFAWDQITDFIPVMIRNRKRGRPFELFRGRRLA